MSKFNRPVFTAAATTTTGLTYTNSLSFQPISTTNILPKPLAPAVINAYPNPTFRESLYSNLPISSSAIYFPTNTTPKLPFEPPDMSKFIPPVFTAVVTTTTGPTYTNSHTLQPLPTKNIFPTSIPPATGYPSEYRSLYRCGLSYDGSASGVSLDMFIFQLETIATSCHLSEGGLVNEMHSVLKGVALQWYWTCRRHNPAISWTELKLKFMERFQDRRSEFEIRRVIESRKQQSRESFLEFYHQVFSLTLQCQTTYSEQKLIELLMQNMRPGLQYQLTDRRFATINELIASCTTWEDTWNRLRIDPESNLGHRKSINEMQLTNSDESVRTN